MNAIEPKNTIHWKSYWKYSDGFTSTDVLLYEYLIFRYKGSDTQFIPLSFREIAVNIKTSVWKARTALDRFVSLGIILKSRPLSAGSKNSYTLNLKGIIANLELIYKLDKNPLQREYLVFFLEGVMERRTPKYKDWVPPKVAQGKFNIIAK
jgi:hypothetical protein